METSPGSIFLRRHTLGGCIEVLEMMKGTAFWAGFEFWKGKVVFFETSEEKPTTEQVRRYLRNYGVHGVFSHASGLLFGRAYAYSEKEKDALEQVISETISGEFGALSFPIVTGMDFGHTEPQIVLPLGKRVRLEMEGMRLIFEEGIL